ncbi:hypothetical protein HY994_02445 [Candidatus Micrarchaeota archaeon]|nr:hypothetical protein [Candidatus Micrarchaeota archaeon]
MKELVFPGDKVADTPQRIPGCYVEDGQTFASNVALRSDDHIVQLKGYYVPKTGDDIIGIVEEERFSGYNLALNSPYGSSLSARDTRDELKLGDAVYCKILAVNEVKEAVLIEPQKLPTGSMLAIDSVKVPRVIGRNGSMLDTLSKFTGSHITIGKNGIVHVEGGNTSLALKAVEKICRESHTSGLTERITQMLENESRANGGQGEQNG